MSLGLPSGFSRSCPPSRPRRPFSGFSHIRAYVTCPRRRRVPIYFSIFPLRPAACSAALPPRRLRVVRRQRLRRERVDRRLHGLLREVQARRLFARTYWRRGRKSRAGCERRGGRRRLEQEPRGPHAVAHLRDRVIVNTGEGREQQAPPRRRRVRGARAGRRRLRQPVKTGFGRTRTGR